MAIAPTGTIYKALEFDNVSSRTYGVYITGEAVYNAPERDVEMITIPGRNGSFALDNGRFQNIEVSYPAGIFAETEADFRQAISDFRNFLCSRKGYVRLQDEYNPNEYRMAVYKSGLEVDPAMLKAGEFEITFDCKPQRYLTSGESAVSVTSGDTITNPTLFESGPLLEVEGLGTIQFNGYTIERNDAYLGNVQVLGKRSGSSSTSPLQLSYTLDLSQLNIGDGFVLQGLTVDILRRTRNFIITSADITSTTNATASATKGKDLASFNIVCNNISFAKGTSKSVTCTVGISITNGNTKTGTEQIVVAYDGANTLTITITAATLTGYVLLSCNYSFPPVIGDSTISTVTHPTFIDCDLGEAYYVVNNEIISVNDAVELPATLPTLAPGVNTITYDNTFTSFSITPRWWKV